MTTDAASPKIKNSADSLLWLAAFIITGVGASWIIISMPWSEDLPSGGNSITRPETTSRSSLPATEQAEETTQSSSFNNPLRMARLAFEAGMLVEPADYSAWSLYQQVLEEDPEHIEARQGLENIATVLLQRGTVALEQSRLEDAQLAADRVLEEFPDHRGAQRLAADIESTAALAEEQTNYASSDSDVDMATTIEPTSVADMTAPEIAEPVLTDALADLESSFAIALADNLLLTPPQGSARHFLSLMADIDVGDERTRNAHTDLFNALIARANSSIDLHDTQAADTWINEAQLLEPGSAVTRETRSRLTAQLVEMESLKRVPASALDLLEYTPPTYPVRAASRDIEGWVDIEFIVTETGETREVTATDSSHESRFITEAVEAVEAWRFRPRQFMGQAIMQHSYTRVRFEIE